MGCNESKNDAVATGNTTVSRRKRPHFNFKMHKDLEPIPEADVETSKSSDNEVAVAPPAAADVKDITVNTDMYEKEQKQAMAAEELQDLLYGESPDTYFSSSDEEAIKAIVEAESGSGYCTPLLSPEPDKDVFSDVDDGSTSSAYDTDDGDNGKQKLKKN